MTPSEKCYDLIRRFEGLRLAAYKCQAGVPTIGYGTTKGVKMGQTCTRDEADKMLREDVSRFVDHIKSLVSVPLTQNQLDALTCFVYNVGHGAFSNSTMLKLINQGRHEDAANQFVRWNKVNGDPVAGLTRRRIAERELYVGGMV